jgi:two-component system chemotaxis response regulator CheY
MKSLIVEDGFVARTVMLELLSPFGPCDVAVDGQEAIDAVRNSLEAADPYDLICLDVMMPGCDGTEVLTRMHELEEQAGILLGDGAKVFMITSSSRHVLASFRANCDAYLVKPVDPGRLQELLAQHLGVAAGH